MEIYQQLHSQECFITMPLLFLDKSNQSVFPPAVCNMHDVFFSRSYSSSQRSTWDRTTHTLLLFPTGYLTKLHLPPVKLGSSRGSQENKSTGGSSNQPKMSIEILTVSGLPFVPNYTHTLPKLQFLRYFEKEIVSCHQARLIQL